MSTDPRRLAGVGGLRDPRVRSARAIRRAFKAVPDLARAITPYADITRAFTVRVPVTAEWLVEPSDRATIVGFWRAMLEEGVGARLLGGGTNTIPVSPFLRGVTVSMRAYTELTLDPEGKGENNVIDVAAGTPLQSLCKLAEREGLGGLAGLAGVPGSVAGALVMNAGGRHGAISEVVESVDVLEPDGRLVQLSRQEAGFAYRHSELTGRLVLGARLRCEGASPEELRAKRLAVAKEKRTAQPLGARSAGCYFKNPGDGRSTGRLIQDAGLKGTRVGGAMSSTHHANFLVNDGAATGADFVALAEQIRERMRDEHGLELNEEVKLWR